MRRVFNKVSDPIQRSRTCPPQQMADKRALLGQGAQRDKGVHEDNFLERPRGTPTPPLRMVKVPITATVEFFSSGEKKKNPPPPPLPTSPRPAVATNPAMTSLQNEDDRRRPTSLPVTPRNEGFRYPGSDLAGGHRRSLRTRGRAYEDDLPVFNNGIGGGPLQRYPIMEDGRPPLFPGPPPPTSSLSRPYNAADAQQPPRRPGRTEQYSYSRNS